MEKTTNEFLLDKLLELNTAYVDLEEMYKKIDDESAAQMDVAIDEINEVAKVFAEFIIHQDKKEEFNEFLDVLCRKSAISYDNMTFITSTFEELEI